jgi:C-terminal processing protease CtpA/Prc
MYVFTYILKVSQLDSAGLVQQSGHIRPADTVILINGEIVTKENADAILQSLENSESHLICVVISRNLHVQARGDNPVEVQTRGDNPVEIQTAVNNLPHSPTSDENGNKKSESFIYCYDTFKSHYLKLG